MANFQQMTTSNEVSVVRSMYDGRPHSGVHGAIATFEMSTIIPPGIVDREMRRAAREETRETCLIRDDVVKEMRRIDKKMCEVALMILKDATENQCEVENLRFHNSPSEDRIKKVYGSILSSRADDFIDSQPDIRWKLAFWEAKSALYPTKGFNVGVSNYIHSEAFMNLNPDIFKVAKRKLPEVKTLQDLQEFRIK
ncbi:hypothetical protein CYMTET_44591 [Cymbomonas tetramitiformis]|uniref:Uncharacterized protein n=1 Tax=Cymbomonas tetramitiformis TaxID=36881 RepID=A0AAE0F0G3_9CHLO|nr:hypothetical protein CYMTET_44591 [Cymbomonas tetramitiformis]